MKSYGEVRLLAPGDSDIPAGTPKDRGAWEIKAVPHVMTRLKRVLPRVRANAKGTVTVVDTPEVARDLEWVLDRWPMALRNGASDHLQRRTGEHRDREALVDRVLEGYSPPMELEPAPDRERREYQYTAADLAIATGRLLVVDDLGLGGSSETRDARR